MNTALFSWVARKAWLFALAALVVGLAADQCRRRADPRPEPKLAPWQPLIPDAPQWRALTQDDLILGVENIPAGFTRTAHGVMDPGQISPTRGLPGLSVPPFEQRFEHGSGNGNVERVLMRYATWPSAEQAEEYRALVMKGNRASVFVAGRCVLSIAPLEFEATLSPDTIRRFRDALPHLGAIERGKLSAGLVAPALAPDRWEVIEERSLSRAEWENSPSAARLKVETVLKHEAHVHGNVSGGENPESAAHVMLTYYQMPRDAAPSVKAVWREVCQETLKAGALVAVLEADALFVEISAATPAILERVVQLQSLELPGAVRLGVP